MHYQVFVVYVLNYSLNLLSLFIFRFYFIKATYRQTVVGVPVVRAPVTGSEQTFAAHSPIDDVQTSRGFQNQLLTVKSPIFSGKITHLLSC